MLQARNIWDLIVARAEESPDREMAVDETGRRLTFGEYRDRCERAAAGLAALGVGDGTVVSWVQPTTARGDGAVRRPAPARRGAEPDPADLPRARGRASSSGRRGSSLLVVPVDLEGLRLRGDGARRRRGHRHRGAGQRPLAARRRPGDPAPGARRRHRRPDRRARPRPLPLLHVGHDGRPQGRPPRRPLARCPRRSACPSASASPRTTASPSCSRSPTSPAASTSTPRWRTGCTFVLDEAFDPATTLDLLRREDITQGGAGTFFHQMYLKAQQDLPEGEKLFPHVRSFPGGGAPKPPSLHYDAEGRVRRSASCRATA